MEGKEPTSNSAEPPKNGDDSDQKLAGGVSGVTEVISLENQDPIARLKIPTYLSGRIPIIGRYYGAEFQRTLEVAKTLAANGFETYPDQNPQMTTITSTGGDVFNFLGGAKMVDPPFMVQMGFFRLIKESDKDARKNFCYVAIQDGYLGRTACIEVAYAMATQKRLLFSELPTKFSPELPDSIVSIVKDHCNRYPLLAIDAVASGLGQAQATQIAFPNITDDQKREIYRAITELERDLRKKFGFKIS